MIFGARMSTTSNESVAKSAKIFMTVSFLKAKISGTLKSTCWQRGLLFPFWRDFVAGCNVFPGSGRIDSYRYTSS